MAGPIKHPADDEIYPINTVVREIKTGVFCVIKDQVFQSPAGRNFLHYLAHKEGFEYRPNQYHVLYHEDIDLESLP
jgi:hypothetical protein